MDITKSIIKGRDATLSYGDYAEYKKQMTSQIRSSRKKLGIATKKSGKYQQRTITAEEIAQNRESVFYHLAIQRGLY